MRMKQQKALPFGLSEAETRRGKWAMVSAVIFCMAAHAFSYFNLSPIHDWLLEYGIQSYLHQVRLGRPLLAAYLLGKGTISVPWITGMLCMLYLGLSAWMLSAAARIESPWEIALLAGFLSVNLSVIELTGIHQYLVDALMLSLLLSCAGAALVHGGQRPGRLLGGAACFWLSFGIYPAFLTTAVVLLGWLALRDLREGAPFGQELKKILLWLLAAFLGGVAYLVLCRVVMRVLGQQAYAYQENNIFTLLQAKPAEVLRNAVNSCRVFFRMLFHGGGYTGRITGLGTTLLALLAAYSLWRDRAGKGSGFWLTALLFVLAFPLLSQLVNVCSGMEAFRTVYAVFLVYPILLRAVFACRDSGAHVRRVLAVVLSALVLLSNVRFSNGFYSATKLAYDRALYHVGRIVEDLQEQGYDPEQSRVYVLGRVQMDGDKRIEAALDRYACISGMNDISVTYDITFHGMTDLLGVRIRQTADPEDAEAVWESGVSEDMPCYPAEGYIRQLGDITIIKLSG